MASRTWRYVTITHDSRLDHRRGSEITRCDAFHYGGGTIILAVDDGVPRQEHPTLATRQHPKFKFGWGPPLSMADAYRSIAPF